MYLHPSDFIRWTVVPVAVLGSMALFRKWFPARTVTHHRTRLSADELEDRFMPLRGRVIGGMILVMVAFFFVTWLGLKGMNHALAFAQGQAIFLFLPQTAIWFFFPGFGALTISWELTLQVMALFKGREEANLFSDWTNQTTAFWGWGSWPGIDSRRILRWMTLLIVLPIGIFTVLALNMHATVGPEVIRDCGYAFKPCSVYRLSDAKRLTAVAGFRTRDGSETRRAGIVIDFKDGRRWSSADWGDWRNSIDPHFADFLERKTGLPLNSIEAEDDLPALASTGSSH
jgi:hypothetical protein